MSLLFQLLVVCQIAPNLASPSHRKFWCWWSQPGTPNPVAFHAPRDTMSFATKLCHAVYADGKERDVMKTPKSTTSKTSLPGKVCVVRENGVPTVYPKDDPAAKGLPSIMKVVYNKRPVPGAFDDFDTVRARVEKEWAELVSICRHSCMHACMHAYTIHNTHYISLSISHTHKHSQTHLLKFAL